MKKPLIGVNTKWVADGGDVYLKLDRNYLRSVEDAGGVPVVLPGFRKAAEAAAFLARLDGVLLTGGPDVDPARWGEAKHPKADLMLGDRERSDFLVLGEALKRDLPMLCICCGHQELNVALGGTLDQHIYDRQGVKGHSGGSRHEVAVEAGTRMREILGTGRPTVNSWHHQAIGRVAEGLRVTALSPDGVIEGVESVRHRWVVGVQWHPERMQDDPRQRHLFSALMAASRA
jgi:putative glutamine amidotransferase